MSDLSGLKPERVIMAFKRAGWSVARQTGSHTHMIKEGNPNILSIPVHKGKPVKQGLLRNQIMKAGLTVRNFLALCK
jgi:predicted RNA binding protein YcfA (HicA-like mRNA interferase family)